LAAVPFGSYNGCGLVLLDSEQGQQESFVDCQFVPPFASQTSRSLRSLIGSRLVAHRWQYLPYLPGGTSAAAGLLEIIEATFPDLTFQDSALSNFERLAPARTVHDLHRTFLSKPAASTAPFNVLARVTGLSPIMETKTLDSTLFLAEISDLAGTSDSHITVTVLVKLSVLTFAFHSLLHVGRAYLFTSFSPRKIRCGTSQDWVALRGVGTEWDIIEISAHDEIHFCQLLGMSSQSGEVTSSPATMWASPKNSASPAKSRKRQMHISRRSVEYTGRITKALKEFAGLVFELDGSMLLFLTHIGVVAPSVRVGATVRLQNVHPIVHRGGLRGFGCCTHSSLVVVESSMDLIKLQPRVDPPVYQRDFVNVLNLVEMCWLLDQSRMLLRKFDVFWDMGDILGGRHLKRKSRQTGSEAQEGDAKLERGLLHILVNDLVPYDRNMYAEFLDHSNHCSLSVVRQDLSDFVPFEDIVNIALKMAKESSNQQRMSSAMENNGINPRFQCNIFDETDIGRGLRATPVLIGQLIISKNRGRMQLADSTAAIDIVVDKELRASHLYHVWKFSRYRVMVKRPPYDLQVGVTSPSSLQHHVSLYINIVDASCLCYSMLTRHQQISPISEGD